MATKLQSILLLDNTVKSCIADLSLNITDQVVARMKKAGKWSYQLDESTDTGKDPQLKVFVRYEVRPTWRKSFIFAHNWQQRQLPLTSLTLWTTSNKKKTLAGKTA